MPNLTRTVLLKGQLGEKREEARAAGAIDPGDMIMLNSSGQVLRNTVVAGNIQVLVALEDPYRSGTITDAYDATTNTLVSYHVSKPGDLLYLRVAAAAPAIVKGDGLEPVSGGTVQKLASGVRVFEAEEAIDNSGGGTKEWVRARHV